MKISANTLKWGMRLYPALFFQGIWTQTIPRDFSSAKVKILKSMLNKNFYGSLFGGTIYTASDPFFVLLFYQYFIHRGYKLKAWVKGANLIFSKPAFSSLILEFIITQDEFQKAEQSLMKTGKYEGLHRVQAINSWEEPCAIIDIEVYLRKLEPGHKSKS